MNNNSKGNVHLFLLIIVVIIAFTGIGYYAYKNGQISLTSSKDQVSVSPTLTISMD
ncbi:MAG: hypothetical protein UT40_C0005G0059 [Candidatus Woesebacteria bacterium GW2011_GWA1_39_21b]|uniref:Uncharacterized protein n=1 Tax=Candidatus Woesebacteria bacterium GW2011_GWA1_39_21b TaxID=1618551 RepID=A0A0G0QV00_9BACT|nr:MAG: hypothetical protein UT40_C0005G0059 [Candidatus Woesebacteria bacterium GW2011_GWA1_39_21b]